jgi:hypothetical protein
MISMLRESIGFLAYVIANSPAELWPLLLALAGSIAFTQVVKQQFISPACNDRKTARICQIVAVISGFAITAIVMPTPALLVAGAIIGAASPVVYFIGVRVISMRWPVVREWLSQNSTSSPGDSCNEQQKGRID